MNHLRLHGRAGHPVVVLAVVLAMAVAGCFGSGDNGDDDPPPETPADTPTTEPTAAATSTMPAPTAAPTATPQPGMACDEREMHGEELALRIEEVMEGFDGEWGFALLDLRCEQLVEVNPEHVQYTASSGKIISAIAVLRAVEEGRVAFDDVQPHLFEVFTWSSDFDANQLETFVSGEELAAVLQDAGVSDASYTEGAWNYTFMTAADLARVWAALVEGELLNEEWTDYLLNMATMLEMPEGLETFPGGDFDMPGYSYGQKAGYYVVDGTPYFMVGAGYLMEDDGPERFVPVFLLRTDNPQLLDPQRREVWPLVVEYVATVAEAELPEEIGPGPAATPAATGSTPD